MEPRVGRNSPSLRRTTGAVGTALGVPGEHAFPAPAVPFGSFRPRPATPSRSCSARVAPSSPRLTACDVPSSGLVPTRSAPRAVHTLGDHDLRRSRRSQWAGTQTTLSPARSKCAGTHTMPVSYFFAYSNFGKLLMASFVAPDSTYLPSCCCNWLTGMATSCLPRPTNPPAPTMT